MEAHMKIAAAQGLEAAHEFAHALEGKLEQLAGRFTQQELTELRNAANELRTKIAAFAAELRGQAHQEGATETADEGVQQEPTGETKEPVEGETQQEGEANNG
jgi:hypothetical protein